MQKSVINLGIALGGVVLILLINKIYTNKNKDLNCFMDFAVPVWRRPLSKKSVLTVNTCQSSELLTENCYIVRELTSVWELTAILGIE